MKKIIILGIIIQVLGILAPQFVRAQGSVTYVSNLGLPSAGSSAVGSNSWLAMWFFTGTNAGGYALNSIQLAMADAAGSSSGFTVMVYTDVGSAGSQVGSSIGTLFGPSDPLTAGIYSFSNNSNIFLSQNSPYFIVLTAGTAISNGAFEWKYAATNPYNPAGRWTVTLGGLITEFQSNNGLFWNSTSVGFPQFAITATAIPEPCVLSLCALGSVGILWQRRKI